MKLVLGMLVIAVMASGCDGVTFYFSTGPSALVVKTTPFDGGTIVVGRPVAGRLTLDRSAVHYRVVPPRTGTLALHVDWDRHDCAVGVQFASTMLPVSAGSVPPIVARLPVQAGQSYDMQIMDGRPGAASALDVSFVVTTSIE